VSTALTIPAQQSIAERIQALYNSDPVTAATAIAQSIDTYALATDDDEKVMLDGLKVVKVAFDLTEKERREALGPVEQLGAWINAGYAKITVPYKNALDGGKKRILNFRAEKAARQAKAEAEARRLAALAAEQAKERGGATLAPPPAAVASVPVANMTKGGIGSGAGTKRMHVRLAGNTPKERGESLARLAATMPHLLTLVGAGDDGWVKGPTQAAVLECKAAIMRNPQLAPTDVPGLEWRWDEGLAIR
jgi:hypothetical protein